MIFQELIDRAAPDQGVVWQYVLNELTARAATMLKESNGSGETVSDIAANATITKGLQKMATNEFHPFLLPINQVQEFLFSKINTEDFSHFFRMKMPFNHVFLDFHGTLRLDGENVKGILVARDTSKLNNEMTARFKDVHGELTIFLAWAVTDKFMQGLNEHYPYYKLSPDKKQAWAFRDFEEKIPALASLIMNNCPCLLISESDAGVRSTQGNNEAEELSESLRKIVVGFCLYVNSVNVEVIRVEGKMSKKRRKQGKKVPEAYYKCKLETKSVTAEESQGDGSSHGYQYDVRGHFKHFRKGKMKGRTLWCPPHRRGLANEVYRPKTYYLIP